MEDHHKAIISETARGYCGSQIEKNSLFCLSSTKTSPCSFDQDLTLMASHLRKAFDRVSSGSVTTNTTNSSRTSNCRTPIGRRMFRRHVDEHGDEFQHAAARCLSSYYSVFVARLAIMVSGNFIFVLFISLNM